MVKLREVGSLWGLNEDCPSPTIFSKDSNKQFLLKAPAQFIIISNDNLLPGNDYYEKSRDETYTHILTNTGIIGFINTDWLMTPGIIRIS